MRIIIALLSASAIAISSSSFAQDAANDECMKSSQDAVASLDVDKVKFEAEVKAISEETQKEIEGQTDKVGGELPFDIKVTMKNTEFVMGVPEVTMKDQKFSLDIVQTKLTDKRMVFDLPGICMRRKKIGQYPEFHGFTVRWTDIIADVPEPCMQRNEVVMGIPEFWVGRTDFVMAIPEFKLVDRKIVMALPQFEFVWKPEAAKDVQAEAEKLGEQTKARIGAKSEAFQAESKQRIAQGVNASFECLRTKVKNQRIVALAPIDGTLSSFQQAISALQAQNAVSEVQNLQGQVTDLFKRREGLVKQFADILTNLDIQEKSALNQMGYGQTPAAPGYITLSEASISVAERY